MMWRELGIGFREGVTALRRLCSECILRTVYEYEPGD